MIEVIRIQEALQKRCERTELQQFQIWAVEHCDGKRFDGVKQHCCSCYRKLLLLQKIPESRSALQYGCGEALKSERMFINGQSIAVVSLKK